VRFVDLLSDTNDARALPPPSPLMYNYSLFFPSVTLIRSRTGNGSRHIWMLTLHALGRTSQCEYKVTLRRVLGNRCCIGQAMSITQYVSACNAHAPYCNLWPASLYNVFPQYLINGTIFEKKKSY
jgi:hypothetical protein